MTVPNRNYELKQSQLFVKLPNIFLNILVTVQPRKSNVFIYLFIIFFKYLFRCQFCCCLHPAATPSYTPGDSIGYKESYSGSIKKLKFTLEQAMKAQRGSTITALLFL